MKKSFFIAVLVLFLGFNNLVADHNLCTPDCEQDPWLHNLPDITFNIGSCNITVSYAYRIACGTTYDILIKSIITSGDCYFQFNPREIMDLAILQILTVNAMNWPRPQNPGECVTNMRVNRHACWWFDANLEYKMCEADICCRTWYKICRDNLNREIITIEDEEEVPYGCSHYPAGSACTQVCDND
jgi:hypothetical protein